MYVQEYTSIDLLYDYIQSNVLQTHNNSQYIQYHTTTLIHVEIHVQNIATQHIDKE